MGTITVDLIPAIIFLFLALYLSIILAFAFKYLFINLGDYHIKESNQRLSMKNVKKSLDWESGKPLRSKVNKKHEFSEYGSYSPSVISIHEDEL